KAGLYASSGVVQVVVDTTPPEIEIDGIFSDDTIAGSADITAFVTDYSAIDRVEFYIDWDLTQTNYEAPYLFVIDSTLLSDGEHMLTVVAFDEYENEQQLELRFYADNTPPLLVDIEQDFHNGIPGWDLSLSTALTDFNTISDVYAIIQSPNGYCQSVPMVHIGNGEYEGLWASPEDTIGYFTIDIVATDCLGNVGMYSEVSWIHQYDYILLTTTRAELELIDSQGRLLNRTWNDFYDVNGFPLGYFFDDDESVQLLLLNPTGGLYNLTTTYLDDSIYTLDVIATGGGLVIYQKSYESMPMNPDDIHNFVITYDEAFSMVWSDPFDDGDISDWSITRGGFTLADGTMTGATPIWNWANIESTVTQGMWSFDVRYAGIDSFNVWFMSNELVPSDYYNPREGYFIQLSMYTDSIQLMRDKDRQQIVLASYTPEEGLYGWWGITVHRDAEGKLMVFVDGILRMEVVDSAFDTSKWFAFEAYNTQSIDNIVVTQVGSVESVADSEALPEVLLVVATDITYVVAGDYLQCQLNWFNIDPGIAYDDAITLEFSDYLEFIDSTSPVTLAGDVLTIYVGSVEGFSSQYVVLTFYFVNLLTISGDELWLNATMEYRDHWNLFDYESRDDQLVTVVEQVPENIVQTSWWWKNEFTFVLNGLPSTYDVAYLVTLVDAVSYSSNVFSSTITFED
ncbi:MAG: Ig-like domain-containing protein, partial [Promethearchaeota archaeon]